MTETTINGVVIETNMAVTIRNGVVECGTDPEQQSMWAAYAHMAMTNAAQQQMYAMRNMTQDEQMIRNSYGRGLGLLRGL